MFISIHMLHASLETVGKKKHPYLTQYLELYMAMCVNTWIGVPY